MSERKLHPRTISQALIGTAAALALAACTASEKAPAPANDFGTAKISENLYDTENFAKGVLVPGILNGNVVVDDTRTSG